MFFSSSNLSTRIVNLAWNIAILMIGTKTGYNLTGQWFQLHVSFSMNWYEKWKFNKHIGKLQTDQPSYLENL